MLLFSIGLFACLNYSVVGTDSSGSELHVSAMDKEFIRPYINEIDIESYRATSKAYYKNYLESKSISDYINYATSLVFLGEYKKALSIFQEIETKEPGKYEVAANLGTIYELIGDNKKAYQWISKALLINENSHHKSEWIHLKILEYKLGKIKLNDILTVDFGTELKLEEKKAPKELKSLIQELMYQLNERTQFVKPKDEIVGYLYYELGNAIGLEYDIESAIEAYKLAKEYGYENSLLDKRLQNFSRYIKDNKKSGTKLEESEESNFHISDLGKPLLIGGGCALLLSLLMFFKMRNKEKK